MNIVKQWKWFYFIVIFFYFNANKHIIRQPMQWWVWANMGGTIQELIFGSQSTGSSERESFLVGLQLKFETYATKAAVGRVSFVIWNVYE